MAASMGVCPYIVRRKKTLFYTASTDGFLADVLGKCWVQLDWLNLNTQDGFKKLRQVKNSETHKRASMKTSDGTEYGWGSQILGRVADIPRKVRGARSYRLFFEEFGSNPYAETSWVQGEALVTRGGIKTGTRFAWGTGGDSGPQLKGLSDIFNKPQVYKILPFKHDFTPSGKTVYTGFFIPAYRMHFAYLDDRGVTNEVLAREYFEKERDAKRANPKAFLEYASEYCFTPDDALIRQGENQFNQALLANQLAEITIHKTVKLPERGLLVGGTEDRAVAWRGDTFNGDILIAEHPIKDEDGYVPRNLYCAGIDSIDIGKADSSGQKDVSDFCIVIKKRIRGLNEPKYVAMYKGRPHQIETAYANAMRLMEYYNCRCVLETTRTNILQYARERKKIHYFMTRPRSTISNVRTNTSMIGTPATENIIRHYLEKIEFFVNEHAHTIDYEEIIDQLLKYDYVEKKKFDIIAAMGMCELADEELYQAPIDGGNQFKKTWKPFGYYKDERGITRYGEIPTRPH